MRYSSPVSVLISRSTLVTISLCHLPFLPGRLSASALSVGARVRLMLVAGEAEPPPTNRLRAMFSSISRSTGLSRNSSPAESARAKTKR